VQFFRTSRYLKKVHFLLFFVFREIPIHGFHSFHEFQTNKKLIKAPRIREAIIILECHSAASENETFSSLLQSNSWREMSEAAAN